MNALPFAHFRPAPLPSPDRLPGKLNAVEEEITLIPYGATLLRMTIFPRAS